jgi:hypothetical protein
LTFWRLLYRQNVNYFKNTSEPLGESRPISRAAARITGLPSDCPFARI